MLITQISYKYLFLDSIQNFLGNPAVILAEIKKDLESLSTEKKDIQVVYNFVRKEEIKIVKSFTDAGQKQACQEIQKLFDKIQEIKEELKDFSPFKKDLDIGSDKMRKTLSYWNNQGLYKTTLTNNEIKLILENLKKQLKLEPDITMIFEVCQFKSLVKLNPDPEKIKIKEDVVWITQEHKKKVEDLLNEFKQKKVEAKAKASKSAPEIKI